MRMTSKEKSRRHRAKKRNEIILLLGGKCCECGAIEKLEFDHIHPRTWKAQELWSNIRYRKYMEEAMKGIIQLLCRSCNSRKGIPLRPDFWDSTEDLNDPIL